MRRYYFLILNLWSICFCSYYCEAWSSEIEPSPLYLKVGQKKTLPKKNIGSVELSQNSAVRLVRSAFDTLSLEGLHKGEGILKILWLNRKAPTFVKIFVTEKSSKIKVKNSIIKINGTTLCNGREKLKSVKLSCPNHKLEIPGWDVQ